jgi:glycosyltransferase involved in cell wall biosynthesis
MHYNGKAATSEQPYPLNSRPKRILYVDHTAKIGGGEIAIFNLVNAIDKQRFHPVFVLSSTGPLVDRLKAANIETYVIELDPSINDTRKDSLGLSSLLKFGAIVKCLSYVRKLSSFMRGRDIDLVHTNSLKAHIFGGIAGRMAGLPVIWHVRDAIDSNYLPRIVAKTVKKLASVIPNHIVANSANTLKKLELINSFSLSVIYSGVSVQGSFGFPMVIHDGCDPNFYSDSTQNVVGATSENRSVVTMVGRIAEWKGQHIFLRAAAAVLKSWPETIFQIAGAPLFGEQLYERSLFALTEELGIQDRVEFLGFRDDIPEIIAGCDVLVHASIIGEPFGQVVIEGMVSGKPVVATNGGALPEIVIDGETGCLVPMGDPNAMAHAIGSLLADPEKRRNMGSAGRERVLANFTIDRCAQEFHHVYDMMLHPVEKSTVRR